MTAPRTTRRALLLVGALSLAAACGTSRPPLAPAGPPPSADAPVMVYGTRTCRHTRAALDFYRNRHVPVTFRDVENDGDALEEMNTRARAAGVTATGIPVLSVRGRVLVGFDAVDAERALRD